MVAPKLSHFKAIILGEEEPMVWDRLGRQVGVSPRKLNDADKGIHSNKRFLSTEPYKHAMWVRKEATIASNKFTVKLENV